MGLQVDVVLIVVYEVPLEVLCLELLPILYIFSILFNPNIESVQEYKAYILAEDIPVNQIFINLSAEISSFFILWIKFTTLIVLKIG